LAEVCGDVVQRVPSSGIERTLAGRGCGSALPITVKPARHHELGACSFEFKGRRPRGYTAVVGPAPRSRASGSCGRPRYRSTRPKAAQGGPRGVPRTVAIAEFIHEQDALPSKGLLEYWARSLRGTSLAISHDGHRADLESVRRTRAELGLRVPERTLNMRDRGPLRPCLHETTAATTRRRRATLRDCLETAMTLIGQVGPGMPISQWCDLTFGRPDLASYSCVWRHAQEELGLTFRQFLRRVEAELERGVHSADDLTRALLGSCSDVSSHVV
jgi:hypothetical protein